VEEAATGTPLQPGAVCPVCGATLALGYGGRVPVHETKLPAAKTPKL